MLGVLIAAAAEQSADVGPYVGGGLGVGALVYAVHRISVAIDRLTRGAQAQLEAWGEHRRRESEFWAEMRKTMATVAEQDRERVAAREAASKYTDELRAVRSELRALRGEVRRPVAAVQSS